VTNWGTSSGGKKPKIIISEERPRDAQSPPLYEAAAVSFVVVCATAFCAAIAISVAIADALISLQ
jgi:hypothetical protein